MKNQKIIRKSVMKNEHKINSKKFNNKIIKMIVALKSNNKKPVFHRFFNKEIRIIKFEGIFIFAQIYF